MALSQPIRKMLYYSRHGLKSCRLYVKRYRLSQLRLSGSNTQNGKHAELTLPQAVRADRPKTIRWRKTAFLDDVQPRVWLYFYALLVGLVAFSLSGIGIYLRNTIMLLSGTFIWLLWFVLMFMICIPSLNRLIAPKIRWLRRGAITLMILFILVGVGELIAVRPIPLQLLAQYGKDSGLIQLLVNFAHSFHYNDGIALTQQATQNVIEGKNPYDNANVITAFQQSGQGSGELVTPLQVGVLSQDFPYPSTTQLNQLWKQASNNPEQVPPEFESKYNYPAGSFLLPAPFLLLGVQDLRIVYLVYLLAALVWVIWLLRRSGWLVFVFGVLASLQLWNSMASGETDTLSLALLLIAWILIKKNWWLSALVMGLAVATKQTAWFFLPFYLIFIFKSAGTKPLVKISGIIGCLFLAANLPFIINGPQIWLSSLTAPMADSMFPTGSGIITFVLSGMVNIQSSMVFGIIEAVVLIGGAIWYYHHCQKHPSTGLVLAIFPLFFAWRSIQSHFFLMDIVLLGAIIFENFQEKEPAEIEPEAATP